MRTGKSWLARFTVPAVALAVAPCTFAQMGPRPSAQPATARQVPLSGRAGQGGSVTATESPVPGATTSINTINPRITVQGPYAGSAAGKEPLIGKLSLRDAVQRGLQYNLGSISLSQSVRQARGQTRVARSSLLPNVAGNLSETVEQLNLSAQGIHFNAPPNAGFSVPSVVGPFNYFDLRASLTQSLVDLTAHDNYRSAVESLRATKLSAQDARDLVVFAVGGAYLQVIAAAARLKSAQAQLDTADALYKQTSERRSVGLVAQIDVNRSRVQMLTEKQRLVTFENDLAKQKINLARIIGLVPDDRYELADDVPYAEAPQIQGDALQEALAKRSDVKAAEAQVRAAQRALSAARAERLPALSVNADYGAIGTNPAQAHGTFSVTGSVKFPIWQGGRISGDIEQANAALAQRQAELEDARGQVQAEVRTAYLDVHAAKNQVEVAQENIRVTQDNLKLTRQRFDAGVADNVTVVQSQESLANAELDYIDAVFAHNVAKLRLARAMGEAAENLSRFLSISKP